MLKKRIARPGRGRSSGFWTIVATRSGDRCFFLYGFAKNDLGNMDDKEQAAPKAWARALLDMPPAALARAEGAGEVMRVEENA